MRLHWLSLIPLFFAFTCSANKSAQPLCEPGTEIFCRCRGGAPGTKLCGEAGDGFGECRLSDGECTEIPDPTTTTDTTAGVGGASSTGVGGAGGAPACTHDLCEPGDPLVLGCDPCTTELCTTVDPYCCDKLQGQKGMWDEMCIAEAVKVCGLECAAPAGSGSTGSATTSTSSGGPQCFGMDVLFPGDVVITEFMNDSSAIADTQGEWFELYNTQSECIDLKGVVIVSANDSKPHVIAQTTILEPKSYIVVCKDKATLASIGVSCAYSVGGAINLGNSSDTLELKTANGLIDGIAYTSTFIHPVGASRALDPTKIDHKSNDSELNWCVSTSFIAGASGDRGTPGKTNDSCN
jgi:hypothetical protein